MTKWQHNILPTLISILPVLILADSIFRYVGHVKGTEMRVYPGARVEHIVDMLRYVIVHVC